MFNFSEHFPLSLSIFADLLREAGSAGIVHCLHGKVEPQGYTGPESHPELSVATVLKTDRDDSLTVARVVIHFTDEKTKA